MGEGGFRVGVDKWGLPLPVHPLLRRHHDTACLFRLGRLAGHAGFPLLAAGLDAVVGFMGDRYCDLAVAVLRAG